MPVPVQWLAALADPFVRPVSRRPAPVQRLGAAHRRASRRLGVWRGSLRGPVGVGTTWQASGRVMAEQITVAVVATAHEPASASDSRCRGRSRRSRPSPSRRTPAERGSDGPLIWLIPTLPSPRDSNGTVTFARSSSRSRRMRSRHRGGEGRRVERDGEVDDMGASAVAMADYWTRVWQGGGRVAPRRRRAWRDRSNVPSVATGARGRSVGWPLGAP